jgi:WD40 repeat protein
VAWGAYDNMAQLWVVASGAERATLKRHTGMVMSTAFSPEGKAFVDADVRIVALVARGTKGVTRHP